MRHSIDRGFHATRAAGFERLAWRVEPDVAALHEKMGDMEVVVVDERDASTKERVERVLVDPLQVMFSNIVGRMRLPGKDDLHWPLVRVEYAGQAFGVVKNQLGPFVTGEPPGESDGQTVRRKERPGGDDAWRADVLDGPSLSRSFADEGEQIAAQRLAHLPQFLVRYGKHRVPQRGIIVAFEPVAAE